jgi:uncharacterized membrane protein
MVAALCALLGLLDSAYLTLERYSAQIALVCPVGGGCETVQGSRWSTLPPGATDGLPVALLGIVGYTVLLGLALTALQRDRVGHLAVPPVLALVASTGVLFSLYLTALQVFVIHALCAWCLGSAILELTLWLAALVDWRAWRTLATAASGLRPRRVREAVGLEERGG